MKEFLVKVIIKNNLLVQRREELGLSVADISKMIGIGVQSYYAYESMSKGPYAKDNSPRPTAVKIADFHGLPFEELWPDAVLAVKRNSTSRKMSHEQIGNFVGGYTFNMSALPDDIIAKKQVKNNIIKYLDMNTADIRTINGGCNTVMLTTRENLAIKMYFGIECEPMTMKQISDDFALSTNRIGQIIQNGLSKIMQNRHSNGIRLAAGL